MSGSDGFGALFGDADDDISAVLDSAEVIRERDVHSLLWSLATAGAHIRKGVSSASGWRTRLEKADRPRSILIATDQHSSTVADLLVELAAPSVPVLPWQRAQLPDWAGPVDVLLAVSIDGMHPRVAGLAAEADRRGLDVVLVAPITSPVSAGAGRAIRVDIDPDPDPEIASRTLFWAVATPLLLACAELHAGATSESVLLDVADALDAVARRCGPSSQVYANEAKQLAIDLSDTAAVILGCGPLPGLAARRTAAALNEVAGRGAIALELPDRLDEALMLARSGSGGAAATDFFRDRVEPAGEARRLVTFSPPPIPPAPERAPGGLREDHDDAPDVLHLATARSAAAVRAAAHSAGLRYSEVVPEALGALAAYAEQSLLGEFVATYVALGTGITNWTATGHRPDTTAPDTTAPDDPR